MKVKSIQGNNQKVLRRHLIHIVLQNMKEGLVYEDADELEGLIKDSLKVMVMNDGIGLYDFWGHQEFDKGTNHLVENGWDDIRLTLDFISPKGRVDPVEQLTYILEESSADTITKSIGDDYNELSGNFKVSPNEITHKHHNIIQKVWHWFLTKEWWSDRITCTFEYENC